MKSSEFKEIVESFCGCDGGDLGSLENPSIWFCGIEFGDHSKTSNNEHNVKLLPIKDPLSIYENDEFNKYLTRSPLNQIIAKIAVRIRKNSDDYKALIKDIGFLKKNSGFCKLNLYPMSFNTTSSALWCEENFKATGFYTKEAYRAFCQEHRFTFFFELVKKHSPKVIVCFGTSELDSFLIAFGGKDSFFSNRKKLKSPGSQSFYVCPVNNNKTTLIVSAFPRYNSQNYENIISVLNELKMVDEH